MSSVIISFNVERFGEEEEKSGKAPYIMNRRAAKIQKLQQELRALTRHFKSAKKEYHHLRSSAPSSEKKLMTWQRAEWYRRRGRERAMKRADFIAKPFCFTVELLGRKRSGHLPCSKEGVDQYLHATLQNPRGNQELEHQSALLCQPAPESNFDMRELSLKEI